MFPLFWAFADLEKANDSYDTNNRHAMFQMLRVYSVEGKLLTAVQSYCVDSMAWFQVGKDVSGWFSVNVGLRHGCVISPCLFN